MRRLLVVLAFVLGCSQLTLQAANDRLRDVMLNVEHYAAQMDVVCAGLYEPSFDPARQVLCERAAVAWIAVNKTWHDLQMAISAAKVEPSDENMDRVASLTRQLFDREVAFVRAVQALE